MVTAPHSVSLLFWQHWSWNGYSVWKVVLRVSKEENLRSEGRDARAWSFPLPALGQLGGESPAEPAVVVGASLHLLRVASSKIVQFLE